jgi:hypothetical protein
MPEPDIRPYSEPGTAMPQGAGWVGSSGAKKMTRAPESALQFQEQRLRASPMEAELSMLQNPYRY